MKNYFAISSLLTLMLVPVLLTGCAFTTDKIELSYKLRGARDKIAGAEMVPVEVTITDNRRVRDRVGKKMNGYGKEMGAIVSTTDVTELVKQAIETELAQRGFLHGNAVLVSGDLNVFYNRFKRGTWSADAVATIDLKLEVKHPGGNALYSRDLAVEGAETSIQMASGHNAKAALETALWKAMDDLFGDPAFCAAILKAAASDPAPGQ